MRFAGLRPLSIQAFLHISSLLYQIRVQAHSTSCKATPNDVSWPSLSQWATLNQTLSGRLIHGVPPATACHSSGPGFNASCVEIEAAWSSFTFHQDNPVSSAWNNMNTDSCLPDPTAPCSAAGYPIYVVNVSSADHVKLAVDFARVNNVRLNVKASGHDYLKR